MRVIKGERERERKCPETETERERVCETKRESSTPHAIEPWCGGSTWCLPSPFLVSSLIVCRDTIVASNNHHHHYHDGDVPN